MTFVQKLSKSLKQIFEIKKNNYIAKEMHKYKGKNS